MFFHISPYISIYKKIATSGEKIIHFFWTSPSKTEWTLSAAKFETAELASTPFSVNFKDKKMLHIDSWNMKTKVATVILATTHHIGHIF